MKPEDRRDRLIFAFLLATLAANFVFRVFGYRQEYLSQFDPNYWKNRYLESQWVVLDSKNPIGDDGLYAYAGWEYIHGADPTLLNPEMPPLGKYLIGLSILVFGNQNFFALICGVLVLFAFFHLNRLTFKNRLLALLPVLLFSLEPLFWQQLRAPFLDLLYLFWLLETFYFFIKKKFFKATVFFGLLAATKNSASTFLLVGLTTFFYFLAEKDWRSLKRWFVFIPVSLIIFCLSYFRYFWLGHTPWEFIGVQKWILEFYLNGVKANFGGVWPMIILGKWPTWWNGLIEVAEWRFTWPLSLALSPVFLLKGEPREGKGIIKLFLFWLLIYLLFLSFVPVWPRYLLVVLPFMYNLSEESLKRLTVLLSHYFSNGKITPKS